MAEIRPSMTFAFNQQAKIEEQRARITELEAMFAEAHEYLEAHTNALHRAEARLAAVIAELHRLRVEWPQDAEWSDLEGICAAATGDTNETP